MNTLLKIEIKPRLNCKRVTSNCSLRIPMKNLMLKVSNALILDFFTALSLVNVPLQKIEATPKFCDSYR